MSALPPLSPYGLPSSPRAILQRQMLSPLDTAFSSKEQHSTSPYSGTSAQSSTTLVDTRQRNRDSLIFINATIPLSPASSSNCSFNNDSQYEGLTPRKRSGLARLFSCFGREERARRRMQRAMGFERVGEPCHWTEY